MARRTRHIIAKDGPHPIDVHVGRRVRLRRTLLGLSQTQVAEPLGITFQQFQKYENGANRISASRLYQAARILDVPVLFFFDGLDEGAEVSSPDDIWLKTETLKFVRAYYRIGDPAARKGLRKLVQAMADLPRG